MFQLCGSLVPKIVKIHQIPNFEIQYSKNYLLLKIQHIMLGEQIALVFQFSVTLIFPLPYFLRIWPIFMGSDNEIYFVKLQQSIFIDLYDLWKLGFSILTIKTSFVIVAVTFRYRENQRQWREFQSVRKIYRLKSVHFKKTVARISFLSKLWYFSIQNQKRCHNFERN